MNSIYKLSGKIGKIWLWGTLLGPLLGPLLRPLFLIKYLKEKKPKTINERTITPLLDIKESFNSGKKPEKGKVSKKVES